MRNSSSCRYCLSFYFFSPTSRMELFRQVRCQTAMFSFLLSLDRTAMDVGNKRLEMTLFIHIPPRISPYSEHTWVTNNGCKVTNRQLSKFHLDRASPASVDKLILILVGRERFLQAVLLTDFLSKERHRSHSREQKPKPKKTWAEGIMCPMGEWHQRQVTVPGTTPWQQPPVCSSQGSVVSWGVLYFLLSIALFLEAACQTRGLHSVLG